MTYYSVFRYLPDPLAEEFINLGVVAFDRPPNFTVCVKFLDRWDRVLVFNHSEDIAFLHEFVEHIKLAAQNGQVIPGSKDLDNYISVTKTYTKWSNCIQLSEPRASILPPDVLVEQVAGFFLK